MAQAAYEDINHIRDIVKQPKRESRVDGWQTIETAPKDGTEVLLYACGDIGVCYWRNGQCYGGMDMGAWKGFLEPVAFGCSSPTAQPIKIAEEQGWRGFR